MFVFNRYVQHESFSRCLADNKTIDGFRHVADFSADIHPKTYNNKLHTINFHAEKFSAYAIAYTSTTNSNNNNSDADRGNKDSTLPTITTDISVGVKVIISDDKKTIAIRPDEGYVIADTLVDGKSIGATDKYTFTDSGNHNIIVVFVTKCALPYYLQHEKGIY